MLRAEALFINYLLLRRLTFWYLHKMASVKLNTTLIQKIIQNLAGRFIDYGQENPAGEKKKTLRAFKSFLSLEKA
jgi:hypothetical protein